MTSRLLVSVLLFLFALPAFSLDAHAQTPANTVATTPASSQVGAGTTVRDSEGREVNVGPEGRVNVQHEGKLKNHPTEPNVKVCDKITGVTVGAGGCKTLTVKGKMDVEITRRGVTVTSNGGAGNPPTTEGATINVDASDVTVNANGTGTTVNQQQGAQNTTVNANTGSSGTITYPQGSGYQGSVNFQAGAGNWSMRGR